jgi:hypothetical protein
MAGRVATPRRGGDRLRVGRLAPGDAADGGLVLGGVVVLRLDAVLQHEQGLRAQLRDTRLGDAEEPGQLLRGATLEEVADHHEAVALRQQRDRVAEVAMQLAGLELLTGLERALVGEDVDEGEVLLRHVADLVLERQDD